MEFASTISASETLSAVIDDAARQIHALKHEGQEPTHIRFPERLWLQLSNEARKSMARYKADAAVPTLLGLRVVIDPLWDGPISVETQADQKSVWAFDRLMRYVADNPQAMRRLW